MTEPSAAGDVASEAAGADAKRAGRGGVFVLGAKAFFIVTGLVQQTLLPAAIGLSDYGALSRVFAVSNVFNNVIVASSTQGVSRTTAAAGARVKEALRATLRVHVGVTAVLVGLFLAAVPLVVWLQRAPDIGAPLVVMAGVLGVYGVYAPLVGFLNGSAQFGRQAALDITAATLRTAGLVGVGFLFARRAGSLAASLGTTPGLLGASCGAVLAALGVFSLALSWTGTGKGFTGARPEGVPAARAYLAFIAPVMLAQLGTNGLMQADIFVLGRYASIAATAAPGLDDPSRAANEWVGVYRACQLFAFLPYQLLFAVTQILFPMLAKASKEGTRADVASLVARGTRIGAIACGAMVSVIVAMPQSLIKLAYGAEIAARGASSLRVLAVGQAGFAILGLATTILVSLGKELRALAVTASALAFVVTAGIIAIPRASFGADQLVVTAWATSVALGLALLVGAYLAHRAAGAFVPVKTAARVALAIVACAALGRFLPVLSKVLTPVVALGVGGVYCAALVLTGELGKKDVALVTSILKRKR
ncbi:MAG: lipopolysaccharide biosynthesis protein [Polyangiaceae bacterium]